MAKPLAAVNIAPKSGSVAPPWSPRMVAELDGLHSELALGRGGFAGQTREANDEPFGIHRGSAEIQTRGRPPVRPAAGHPFIVPVDVEHRPVGQDRCELWLIEPANSPNTGYVAPAMEEEWI